MCLLYISLYTYIHKLLITIRPWYISNWNSRSSYIKNVAKHWCIQSDIFLIHLILHVPIALTVTNTFSACFLNFHVVRINPGTSGAALTSRCSGHSGSSMPLSCSISDSMSAMQSSLLWFGLFKFQFQWIQFSVSEMLSGVVSSSVWTGRWLICLIRRTFDIRVRSPGRSFADNCGGKGDLSDNLNAAAPSCWKSDQDALTISFVSEMYPTAVICMFWAGDYFWLSCKFWLPCHIYQKSWTLAILCNCHSSVCFIIAEWRCVFLILDAGSSPARIPSVAWAHSIGMTVLWMVLPVGFQCLHPRTSRAWEKLASSPTPCGMMEK